MTLLLCRQKAKPVTLKIAAKMFVHALYGYVELFER